MALQRLPNIGTLTTSAEYALRYRAPRDKQIVGFAYEHGLWNFGVRETRRGKLRRLNSPINSAYYIAIEKA